MPDNGACFECLPGFILDDNHYCVEIVNPCDTPTRRLANSDAATQKSNWDAIVTAALFPSDTCPELPVQYDASPSDFDKNLFHEINLCRVAPQWYAEDRLRANKELIFDNNTDNQEAADFKDPKPPHFMPITYDDNATTMLFQVTEAAAFGENYDFYVAQPELPPLKWSETLYLAAQKGSLSGIEFPNNQISHDDEKGFGPSDRVAMFTSLGLSELGVGESLAWGPKAFKAIIAQLNVDEGVANRGHRLANVNDKFTHVGIHTINDPKSIYHNKVTIVFGIFNNDGEIAC
jgi:hypothetical protein